MEGGNCDLLYSLHHIHPFRLHMITRTCKSVYTLLIKVKLLHPPTPPTHSHTHTHTHTPTKYQRNCDLKITVMIDRLLAYFNYNIIDSKPLQAKSVIHTIYE